jgi:hypothetical protein
MIRPPVVAVFLLGAAAPSVLGGALEVAAYVGPALPRYEQSFQYDLGPNPFRLPGVTLEQNGVFQLDGRGGLSVGGGLTWYFLASTVGIEGRVDTADVDVRTTGARYTARVDLPSPLPDLTTDVDLGTGTVDLDRLRPLSLNVKVKTPGPLRLTASAGVSYLPEFRFVTNQTVGLGVSDVGLSSLDVATVRFRAEALPNEQGRTGRLGANAGGGLQVSILPTLAVVVEARVFIFKKHTLVWQRADRGSLSPIEEALAQELERQLEPVEFNPTFFQATAGLTLTF